MASSSSSLAPPLVTRPVAQVRRRLFVQLCVDLLVWCLSGALLLSACWFVVQPLLWGSAPAWLRWAAAGGLVGSAAVLAGALAWLRLPSKAAAALALDEKFSLKERVTTLLLLSQAQADTPAGQALLADVQQRIDRLDVGTRFPFSLSRSAFLAPLSALVFAGVAFFYEPPERQALVEKPDESKQPPANVAAIEEKMKQLKKKPVNRPRAVPRSEDLERLEAELEKIANRPRNTKDQLRERVKEMKSLEDTMQKREKELADKLQSLKKQLAKMNQNEEAKEGQAKDLQKALSEGNLDKTSEELKKIAEKMKKNELSDQEKQDLAKQLKEVGDKLKRLADQKDKQEQLQKLKDEGKLDKEAFEREMNRLKQESENLKELKELADKLGECQESLKKGDGKSAEQKLKEASEKLKEMGADEQDLEDLRDQMEKLKDAKDCCKKGLDKDDKDGKGGDGDGQDGNKGNKDGNGQGDGQGDGVGDTNQPNKGGIGAGRRPLGKEGTTKSYESKGKTPFDPKGKKILEGYAPGQNFKKKTSAEVSGEIQQAGQEAAEALEQQRIPREARKMAKGYFQNLSGAGAANEKEKKDKE